MPTNILALPLAQLDILTGNNEDWLESVMYVIDDGTASPTQQIDLRGIKFEMEVRRSPPLSEVIISGSTDDGSLLVGTAPDYGYLMINVVFDRMKNQEATAYVGDIVALADGYRRVAIQFNLTIFEGITRNESS
jgi:hypothetical protein